MSVIKEILFRRWKGYSSNRIYYEIRDIYGVSRREVREILYELAQKNKCGHGGYRSSSGRGSPFIFDGQIYDSYYELCWYIFRKEVVNDEVIKNYVSFKTAEGNYTPDFSNVDLNKYYEIKRPFESDFHRSSCNFTKLNGLEINLEIVPPNEIQDAVTYCNKTYGKGWSDKYRKDID